MKQHEQFKQVAARYLFRAFLLR